MMRRTRWGGAILGSTLILLLFLNGCKESEDLTGVGLLITPDFLADPNSAGLVADLVTIEKGAIHDSTIILDVVVTEVSEPVSGISLKIRYPHLFSKFISCRDGSVFSTGSCQASEAGPGEVFIGRSLISPETPQPVTGSRVIVRLEFLLYSGGDDTLILEAQNVGASDATALLDANGDPILVDWFTGMLSGR